jgi:cold shock CspA family protein
MNRFLAAAAKTGAPALRIRHAVPSSSSSAASSSSSASTMRCAVASRRLFSDSSAPPSSVGGPGDSEIKFGTVKNFGLKGGFGFIIPDGVHKTGHAAKDLVFIHRADIMLKESKDGEAKYYPR